MIFELRQVADGGGAPPSSCEAIPLAKQREVYSNGKTIFEYQPITCQVAAGAGVPLGGVPPSSCEADKEHHWLHRRIPEDHDSPDLVCSNIIAHAWPAQWH